MSALRRKTGLGVFFQIPVVCQANFGIVADAAESFNLSVDSGEGMALPGFHNVGVDLAAIAGVAAPFRLVNSGVAAAVNTLGVLVHHSPTSSRIFTDSLEYGLWHPGLRSEEGCRLC